MSIASQTTRDVQTVLWSGGPSVLWQGVEISYAVGQVRLTLPDGSTVRIAPCAGGRSAMAEILCRPAGRSRPKVIDEGAQGPLCIFGQGEYARGYTPGAGREKVQPIRATGAGDGTEGSGLRPPLRGPDDLDKGQNGRGGGGVSSQDCCPAELGHHPSL